MSELPPPTVSPDPWDEPLPEEELAEHEVPWWGPLAIAGFVGLVVCTNIANAVWARWVSSDPEQLLLLSSRNRYLALTLAAGVSVVAYAAIAFVRIGAAFVVCHLIGRAYAEQAIGWFKKYLGFNDEAERGFHRGFDKAEWALIPFFAGSNIVAALTGVRRTPPVKLAGLLAIGIVARLSLMWWLARTFEDQLVDFLEWVARYQWWVVAASVGVVVLVNLKNFRRG
ncbi:MAG: hypothetical protein AAGG08_09125 [Actinomycetota bacterium]